MAPGSDSPGRGGGGVLSPVEFSRSLSSLEFLHDQILVIKGMVTSFKVVTLSGSMMIGRAFAFSSMTPATVMSGLVLVPTNFLQLWMNLISCL